MFHYEPVLHIRKGVKGIWLSGRASSTCRKHTVASIARYQAFLRLQTGLKRYELTVKKELVRLQLSPYVLDYMSSSRFYCNRQLRLNCFCIVLFCIF